MTIVYDLAEPIEAYRVWRVLYHNGTVPRLTSASFSLYWESRDFTAQPCKDTWDKYSLGTGSAKPDDCGGPPCAPIRRSKIAHGCGIYAHKTLGTALWELPQGGIIGKILIAGKVFEYSQGWRAQKARIAGIYGLSTFKPFERYIGRDIGVYMSPAIFDIAKGYEVPFLELTDAEASDVTGEARLYWLNQQVANHLIPAVAPAPDPSSFRRHYYSSPVVTVAQARSVMGLPKINPSVT